ncbi:class I SAM-dependent methyltransferase [Desulfosediminicola sp.]|uniref:class I SAM-dependent methyltransferase n=1 Tax=Desulfosediminicola sp. TaxID=2886825 RepID=UPI003AF28233
MAVNLKTLLQDSLSPDELDCLVRSYDVIGDIAMIIIPDRLIGKEHLIGETILRNNKRIKVVAKRVGIYGGEYRTIGLEILAGENRKETEHKEFGIRLQVNPERVYFSVRSGTERKRIANLVREGENVLVLFSGIAPYPLVIGGNSCAQEIVGIEKNPEAHNYAVKNLKLNRKIKNVKLYCGDVAEIVPSLDKRFDRIVMPLPTRGHDFLDMAVSVLKENGTLHYYDMQKSDNFKESQYKVNDCCIRAGRQVLEGGVTRCGHCAPRTFRICVDAVIR